MHDAYAYAHFKEKWPLLYGDIPIDCHSGWKELLEDLSEKLYAIMDKSDDPSRYPAVCQVKSKYGTLRYYLHWFTDEMQTLVNEAEDKSEKICEICGKPGELDLRYFWVETVCNEHKEERTKRCSKQSENPYLSSNKNK